ncbi:MAG: class I SAM-dependent methyltransferase [Candidatus Rhabdochlamydia sp.]
MVYLWDCFIRMARIKARLIALKAHLMRKIRAESFELPACAYLNTKLKPLNLRYHTFAQALRLIQDRKLERIVETGTSRFGGTNCAGDGCSSLIFTDYINNYGGKFYSVDIDKQALLNAQRDLKPDFKNAYFICSDSIKFLHNFSEQIDFLYLDSYDFEVTNPLASQKHHLLEVQAAYPKLHKNSVIMIDDCMLPRGGKGKLAIDFLIKKGWKILIKGYQVILVQD